MMLVLCCIDRFLMLASARILAVMQLRNCAVNTLFSAAVGNGSGLSSEEWKQFLLEVTFPLIEEVSATRGTLRSVSCQVL